MAKTRGTGLLMASADIDAEFEIEFMSRDIGSPGVYRRIDKR